MDFISTLLALPNIENLLQIVYVALLVWLLVIYIPKRDKHNDAEREKREAAFIEERKERDQAFLETINSYRDALIDFQQKEDEAHTRLIEMVSTHDEKSREGHKQLLRILRAIADKLDTKLYEE